MEQKKQISDVETKKGEVAKLNICAGICYFHALPGRVCNQSSLPTAAAIDQGEKKLGQGDKMRVD